MRRSRVGAAFAPMALALGLVVQLAGSPAQAGVFDDDEARHRIDVLKGRVDQLESSLNQRIGALESTVKSQGLVDLLKDVEDIKADVAKLRGQYEVLTYELDQSQKRQRDLYLDLDGRLRKLEGTAPGAAPANAAPAPMDESGQGSAKTGAAVETGERIGVPSRLARSRTFNASR